ncbi:MAG TPA: hypothetical protein VFV55_11770 [Usitatibacteraceae bacterium]|nr:hypothetical protein [Usitatibacteraceae bacterium]
MTTTVPEAWRRWIPTAITVALIVAMLAYGPIHQPADYHDFADRRAALGVANAADVVSNIGFALAGLWGLAAWSAWMRLPDRPRSSRGYAVFFVALVLTGLGSAWYHLLPDNGRLVWDRIPIALACAGLLAAVHADTHSPGQHAAIPVALVAAAFASVWWWSHTGVDGPGDLRPYLLLQVLPLLLIPVWQALYGARREERLAFGIAIALYVGAKAAELGDHAIFDATGFLSGHTLKHLLATAAGAVVAADYRRRAAEAMRSK